MKPKPAYTRYARTLVYAISAIIALVVYGLTVASYPVGDLRYIRLTEAYGFLSAGYLYLALLPSPLYFVFPNLPGKWPYYYMRRAIGISTFVFALLHSSIAFFKLLSGFQGIPFLSHAYRVDLSLSLFALFILFLLAATSFDYAFKKMGPWWGRLHRFVYLAGCIVLVHVMAIGAHFTGADSAVPLVFFTLVYILLVLQSFRLAVLCVKTFGTPRLRSLYLAFFLAFVSAGYGYALLSHHFHHH